MNQEVSKLKKLGQDVCKSDPLFSELLNKKVVIFQCDIHLFPYLYLLCKL